MWNPAISVPEYLPRRSTTHACCCGTTRAILETRTIAKIAKTKVTRTPAIESPFLEPSGSDVKHQSLNALDRGALSPAEQSLTNIARAPGASAHFRFPHSRGRHIAHQRRLLADHRVDDFGHAQFQ